MSFENPKIALIEASPDICQLTAQAFRQLGCEIRCWRDGLTAWRNLQIWKPDIAIVDLDLKGMDGFQLGQRLRECHASRLLLIATTCVPNTVTSTDVLRAGFDEIVGKPYDIEDLVQAMERAVLLTEGRLRRVA